MRLAVPVLVAAALWAPAAARAGGLIRVAAAEDVWGSIAAQLGGTRAQVTSVIANPATDPHDYEPTAVDARTMAAAQLVVVNGIGYDPWASQLVAANPVHGGIVLTVGDVVGVAPGGNPHVWYSPVDVLRVVSAIARGYEQLDPAHRGYFAQRRRMFETRALARYRRLIANIRRRYHGVAIGASESIVAPLARALGLRLVTPDSFLNAVGEGTEPTAHDIETVDAQIGKRLIRAWIFNSQNSTPDVQRITDAAKTAGIPVTTMTETIAPASASFQGWQSRQLAALEAALEKATGR